MKYFVDLHIHSKYARACSPQLTVPHIALWSDKKGLGVVGTGDFTHPAWFKELRQQLIEEKPGLYKVKNSNFRSLFMLTTELASVYKKDGRVRRVHNLVFAPNFTAVEKFIKYLNARGVNLKADGRPVMGIECDELVKIVKEIDSGFQIVPAHIWTPHFGVFGSLSGFDTLEEAYGDQAKYILAVESGISSDLVMNRSVSLLDKISVISNSDAHSLRRLGREANYLNIPDKILSYSGIIKIIRENKPQNFLQTIEFYPQEGRYYLDGHAGCKFSCTPTETHQLAGICPKCHKKLLRGVMSRVTDLATTQNASAQVLSPKFTYAIPLDEVIAETLHMGVLSKKVQTQYTNMVGEIPELQILINASVTEIASISTQQIAENVLRCREGRVAITPGFDGNYGKIQILAKVEL